MHSRSNPGIRIPLNNGSPFTGISWMNLNSNTLTCFTVSTVLYCVEGGREDYVSSGWTANWKFEVPLRLPLSPDCMTHVFFLSEELFQGCSLERARQCWEHLHWIHKLNCCTRIAESHQTPQELRIMQMQWELYYKLEQELSSHDGEGALSESHESFIYCIAGEAGREA